MSRGGSAAAPHFGADWRPNRGGDFNGAIIDQV